jgi:predicted DNA-binding helix-hairpin-helix protein
MRLDQVSVHILEYKETLNEFNEEKYMNSMRRSMNSIRRSTDEFNGEKYKETLDEFNEEAQ